MARINIEDCWWTDPRRERLAEKVGGLEMADATAIRTWKLAQEHWKESRRTIPVQIFESLKHAQEIIAAGLAVLREDGTVYVRGSSQYLDWLFERREAARSGGRRSAQNRKDDQPNSNQTQPNATKPQPNATKRNPLVPVPSLIQTLKEKEIQIQAVASAPAVPKEKKGKFSEETRNKMRAFIAAYAENFKKRYGGPPEGLNDKALVGKIGHWIEGVPEARSVNLVEVYLQVSDKWIVDRYHDLWTFFRVLNQLGIALETGKAANEIDWGKVFVEGGKVDGQQSLPIADGAAF